ncbi:MAG: hypothetical protein JJU45_13940 [Acidimicrobiia bacterium]|nr:hypothetical protein [Acidimicrobiia bacterium]
MATSPRSSSSSASAASDVGANGGAEAPDAAPTPAEQSPERRHHRLRWALVTMAAVVVGVIGVGWLVVVVGHRPPEERSLVDAVDEFRAAAGDADGPTDALPLTPAPGVYAATGSGNEFVGFSPLDEPFGPEVPVTVTSATDGCWTLRADLNSHHWRSWTLCPGADGDLARREAVTATERNFPGINYATTTTFTCEPPAPLLWSSDEPERTSSCTGVSSTVDGTTTAVGVTRLVGTETITVGDATVDTLHVQVRSELEGVQPGTDELDFWLDPDSGLPLRISFDSSVDAPTPFGTIPYRDAGEVVLTAATPRT